MSKYAQASLRRKMQKADKQTKRGNAQRTKNRLSEYRPIQERNTAGQRHVRRVNNARRLLAGVIVPLGSLTTPPTKRGR